MHFLILLQERNDSASTVRFEKVGDPQKLS